MDSIDAPSKRKPRTVVAIPVRDEAERIGQALISLDRQIIRPDSVLLFLNNCTDDSELIARRLAPRLRFQLQLVSLNLPPEQASAGLARRQAMQLAADQAGPDGVLLTTDADAVVPPDWVVRNLAALRQGVDIVCGKAIIDPMEAAMIPVHLHADDALESRLIALLDEMGSLLDPEMHDPPPRHTEASGASLAVSVDAFRRVGGIPAIPSSEDRAFVRALWLIDARVRHDPAIRVTVSGRIEGRATDGMADAIRRRMVQQDEFTDDQAEPANDALRRYDLRQRVRRAWSASADGSLAVDLGVSKTQLADLLAHRYFGQTWAATEAACPILRRRCVRFADLPAEISAARALLDRLPAPRILLPDALAAD